MYWRVQIETNLHCLSSTTYDTEVDHGLFDNKLRAQGGKREIEMTCQSNIYSREGPSEIIEQRVSKTKNYQYSAYL
jgi:hypothetical protein